MHPAEYGCLRKDPSVRRRICRIYLGGGYQPMKRNGTISAVIFWGALWGLTEATAGHLLHVTGLGIGWLFWFPAAFYFMNRVYRMTDNPGAILSASFVAAAIKLVDLLAPVRLDYVFNPAVSIILEGLAVFALFGLRAARGETRKIGAPAVLLLSMGWRVLYLVYVLFLPADLIGISPWGGAVSFLRFFFLESLANSLVIAAYLKAASAWRLREKARTLGRLHPALSAAALALAVFVTWLY